MPIPSVVTAKRDGLLVYEYRQGDADYNYNDIGPWGQVRNGYCAALGFQWIAARLRGSDLPYDAKTRLGEKADWKVTRLHNLTKTDGYDSVLLELGLQRGAPKQFLGIPSEIQLVPWAAKTSGCYMLQLRRDGGGHLVAIQNEGSTFRYFDANFGEFAFKSINSFQSWFGGFLNDSGYRRRYTVEVLITQVTWKQGGGVAAMKARFGG